MPPPMPPIPPMPPPPPPIESGLSSFTSKTIASVVVMRPETDAASTSAVRTTLVGSIMPLSNMLTYSPFCASYPTFVSVSSRSLPTITAPSSPALAAMVRAGTTIAFWTISMPMRWSTFSVLLIRADRRLEACKRAEPPPGTMPSSTAARVALSASTTRSFFSPTSLSVAPPTLMTAIPPESFARRSWSFSFSYSEVVLAIEAWRSSTRSSMSAFSPAPSRTIVSSFETVTFLAEPSMSMVTFSSLRPTSSEIT
mmetsp:Transcript_1392/g.2151  ORF Transcript_1392/g.2151 Transcript_1392/m.2151 type:complete len:254 (-) Transcript_1392:89-850(-)